jgi:hypothetical protein
VSARETTGRPTCAACRDHKVQHDQDMICLPCLRQTRERLHRLPGLIEDLETSLAGMAVLAERNDGGKSAQTALAYTEAAGDALREIRQMLIGWTRLLHEEKHVPLPADRLVSMVAHLSVHAGKLVTHPAADEWVGEVAETVRDATTVIDLPINRLRVRVGPCPENQENEDGDYLGPCPGMVTAIIPTDQQTRPTMTCGYCKTVWYPEQWNSVGHKILQRQGLPRPLDLAAAEKLLGRIAS